MHTFKKWIIGIISFLLIIITILFCVSGFFIKKKYTEPWGREYYKRFEDPRLKIIAHGILAPNSMNLQMWKFKMDEEDANTFYMYADAENDLKSDVGYNDCIICQGTFAEYCIEAGKELGYEVDVKAFPNGMYDESNFIKSTKELPVAKLTLAKNNEIKSQYYDMLYTSHTVRRPFEARTITNEDKNTLLSALNNYLGIGFEAVDDNFDVAGLRDLAYRAKETEQSTKSVVEGYYDITRTNEYVKNETRFGVSLEANGEKGFKKHMLQGLTTLLPFLSKGEIGKDYELKKMKSALESTKTFFFLKADKNRLNQFNTGRVYARLRLIAKSLNIGMQPLSQIKATYPEMKEISMEFNEHYDKSDKVILILRAGYFYQNKVDGMRKDVSQFIIS